MAYPIEDHIAFWAMQVEKYENRIRWTTIALDNARGKLKQCEDELAKEKSLVKQLAQFLIDNPGLVINKNVDNSPSDVDNSQPDRLLTDLPPSG